MYADRDTRELQGENEQQATKRPQGRPAESGGAGELAGTNRIRLSVRRGITGDVTKEQPTIAGACRWPARPGQEQYPWEKPRTVKSGMGRTVDGFKSKVDELRLLGNGVVPQTAELAFRTLWEKHNVNTI
ncbi:hypothetical protein KAR91_81305 [Candidatus Pacearchaeota archaeon]|nr:hypothetical protein [Candidatus Pacearchaeota archaeon]